jgi:hypothetical protein
VTFLWPIQIRIPSQYPKIGTECVIDEVAKLQKCLKMKTLVQRWCMGVGLAVSSYRQLITAVKVENIHVLYDSVSYRVRKAVYRDFCVLLISCYTSLAYKKTAMYVFH